jgi:DNA-binding PadR family transcriptional regulator
MDRKNDLSYDVGKMARNDSLGSFEQLVLTAILALEDNAYGVTIHDKVNELAKPKHVLLGAIYVTLDRMEDKGLVKSWLSDPTPERGGRAKRFYKLQAPGQRALQESLLAAKRLCDEAESKWGAALWNPNRRWKPVRAK